MTCQGLPGPDPTPNQPQTGVLPEICGVAPDAYARALADLLPQGEAWNRDPDGVLMRLIAALSGVLIDGVTDRLCRLFEQIDPRTVTDELDRWERWLGLPDPCAGPAPTDLDARRRRVLAVELASEGGALTENKVRTIAAALRMTVSIRVGRPFYMGDRVGRPLGCWHSLEVTVCCAEDETQIPFLRCLLRRMAPAHIGLSIPDRRACDNVCPSTRGHESSLPPCMGVGA